MAEHDFDIVIVGSGAGGGTVAAGLADMARAGVRIAVLEAGPRLRREDFTGREVEMARRLYFDSGGTLTRDRSLTIAAGCAWGGSTVVYTGTSLVVPEEVIRDWNVPGLGWDDVRRRSERFMEAANVHLLPEELINGNNRLFVEGCRALGIPVEQFPLNIKGCRGSGLCNLGCPNGAKQGTHEVQLPEAEAAGVEMITGARVTRLGDRELHVEVAGREFGEPPSWEPGPHWVRARMIVLAAGAVRTPALLLHSGFGGELPQLGRYLTLHPALILAAEHPGPVTNVWGHPKSYYTEAFQRERRFLLETCMYFPFVTAKNLVGFGAEHSELMRAYPRMQQILVLALDEALREHRVSVDREGAPVVDYSLTEAVLDTFHDAMKTAVRIFFAAGARRVHAPAGVRFFLEPGDLEDLDRVMPRRLVRPGRLSVTSAHPMGGCRMGRDASDSVTDGWGRVHGVPWLRVADASLFPRCSEVNPYLTVMALADRAAEAVRNDYPEVAAS